MAGEWYSRDPVPADLLSRRLRSLFRDGWELVQMKYVSGEGAVIRKPTRGELTYSCNPLTDHGPRVEVLDRFPKAGLSSVTTFNWRIIAGLLADGHLLASEAP